jgi:hypothetical protein
VQLAEALNAPLADAPPAETPPAEMPPAETPPAETLPAEASPVETLPAEAPAQKRKVGRCGTFGCTLEDGHRGPHQIPDMGRRERRPKAQA